ncbi:beta-lactamase family protein [Actinoplanes sp. LDG1-06]|uniref:Beta-lactamase family protein n=1 Tax=Paractinoplanes ovalisporus TaxID=2810368 RepID=A0ABS2A5F4_9ACTN|nr:serine hydrolase domain-containing protein [Actinoplanes ovalisporus]MBM2614960.1 beta-lactamase family protein [Actinoplanes ovalisporus]
MRKTLLVALVLSLIVVWPGPARASGTTIDDYLREAFDATGLPGMSVVVTKDDQVVHASALGDGVTVDTPMRVASISKSFTAAAVLALVDEGRVELDEPVVTYLPEFRMADERAGRTTVRQLLNQTSGLSDRTVDIAATQHAKDLAGYVGALRDGRLAGEPGSRWEYCNVNYDVAARLVEVVDGRSFPDAVREKVFAPLGMKASSVGDDVADGYNSLFGWWVRRPELPGFRGGAGGVVTTASDMGRWLISQTGHGPRTLTRASLAVMHEPAPGTGYAMGWGPVEVDGHTLLVHSGNLFTYTAVQAVDPATGYGYAVLTDSAGLRDDTYDIMLGLVALTDGREPAVPGHGRQWIELALALVALLAIGLGVLGVLRPGRRLKWLRLAAALTPVVVFVTYPQWVSFLTNGRAVTWAQMTYFAAPLTITIGIAAAAGLAAAVACLIRLVRLRSSR